MASFESFRVAEIFMLLNFGSPIVPETDSTIVVSNLSFISTYFYTPLVSNVPHSERFYSKSNQSLLLFSATVIPCYFIEITKKISRSSIETLWRKEVPA